MRKQYNAVIRKPSRTGAAAVEFAVVAPLFLTLVIGTLEIGNALSKSNTLYAALRGAGRLASMDFTDRLQPGQSPNDKIISDIRGFLSASGIPGNDVAIEITHAGGTNEGAPFDLADSTNYLKAFRISASVPYSSLASVPNKFMAGKSLTASVVFRMAKTQLID